MSPVVYEAIEYVNTYDRMFRTANGAVDLLAMSTRLDPTVFRSYIQAARVVRSVVAHRAK
jgi:hypothetical protein